MELIKFILHKRVEDIGLQLVLETVSIFERCTGCEELESKPPLKSRSLMQFRWIRPNLSECEITLHKITMPKRDEGFVQSLELELVVSFENGFWSSSCAK